jgi:hypothetical protein
MPEDDSVNVSPLKAFLDRSARIDRESAGRIRSGVPGWGGAGPSRTIVLPKHERLREELLNLTVARLALSRRFPRRVPGLACEAHPAQDVLEARVIQQEVGKRAGEAEYGERALVVGFLQ